MNREIILKLIETKAIFDIRVLKCLFSKCEDDIEDYFKVTNQGYILGGLEINRKVIFTPQDKLTLKKGDMGILESDIETTVGRAIYNYIFLEWGLQGKFKYINKPVRDSDIEDLIIDNLGKTVTMEDYKRFGNCVGFKNQLADVIVVTTTEKITRPPKGIAELKKQKMLEYDKKYGKDWTEDKLLTVQFDNELMKWYKDYLKDEPPLGVTVDGKVLGQSLKRRYVSQGLMNGMDGSSKFVESSLIEGLPKDKKKIAAVINNIYFGAYGRGLETKDSGTVAKQLIRFFHSFVIVDEDCGTKDGYDLYVDRYKNVMGLYNMKGEMIDEKLAHEYVGKTVTVRYPLYCKSKGDTMCKKCTGEVLGASPGGISLYMIMIGGMFLKFSLKKFHSVDLDIHTIKKDDLF
jgi:hypothetical protein